MSKAKKSTQLKRIAKRLAAYSATAAATVMTQDRMAEAGEVVWEIPDITAGPSHGHWVVFNMVSGAYATTANFAGHSTSGKIRLAGYYSGYPNPYIYTPANSTFGAFVTNPGGLYGSDALRLSAGVTVSGGLPFGANPMYLSTGNYANLGSWSAGDSGFVGIRFNLNGDPHYGWAEISRISDKEVTLHSFGYNDADGSPSVIPSDSGITGDFNGDMNYDSADVDPLVADIAAGGNTASFDLNGDGSVDTADLTSWLAEAGEFNLGPGLSYLPGDADLSGVVDAGDLNSLGIHWQQQVAAWSAGDFTANGTIDAQDLNVLGVNWQMSSLAAEAAVPEPSGVMLLAAGAAGLGLWRRRKFGQAA